MKKQITHFSVHQTSKVMALVAFIISAIFAIPVAIVSLISTGSIDSLIVLLMPLLYLVFAYVGWAIFAFLYNVVASSFGGIEITLAGESTESTLE